MLVSNIAGTADASGSTKQIPCSKTLVGQYQDNEQLMEQVLCSTLDPHQRNI